MNVQQRLRSVCTSGLSDQLSLIFLQNLATHRNIILLGHHYNNWAPSSELVSSSIPSLQILTAHAQPFRGARDLAFCLKVPLDSLLVWASSGGSGETARMRRLPWTFAARIGNKYQICLMRSNCYWSGKKEVIFKTVMHAVVIYLICKADNKGWLSLLYLICKADKYKILMFCGNYVSLLIS